MPPQRTRSDKPGRTQLCPADVRRRPRAARNGHRSAVFWLTALPGAGKSTIAYCDGKAAVRPPHAGRRARRRQHAARPVRGPRLLDRRSPRECPPRREGGGPATRSADHRARCARLADAGRARTRAAAHLARRLLRGLLRLSAAGVPAARSEGTYAKAQRGALAESTGVSSPYEPPTAPALALDTARDAPDDSSDALHHPDLPARGMRRGPAGSGLRTPSRA
ncbi:adenylylsulfate kinase [Paraburkholderia caballeronis]|nr:adenylylsulfate kinase [Paraburkholderia caballeronis]